VASLSPFPLIKVVMFVSVFMFVCFLLFYSIILPGANDNRHIDDMISTTCNNLTVYALHT